MPLRRIALGLSLVGLMGLDAKVVCGQSYPNKPIRIVTAGVGGSNDFASRVIEMASAAISQQTILNVLILNLTAMTTTQASTLASRRIARTA